MRCVERPVVKLAVRLGSNTAFASGKYVAPICGSHVATVMLRFRDSAVRIAPSRARSMCCTSGVPAAAWMVSALLSIGAGCGSDAGVLTCGTTDSGFQRGVSAAHLRTSIASKMFDTESHFPHGIRSLFSEVKKCAGAANVRVVLVTVAVIGMRLWGEALTGAIPAPAHLKAGLDST